MERFQQIFLLGIACWAPVAGAATLQVLTGPEPVRVFGGSSQNLPLTLRSTGERALAGELRARISQVASSITAPLPVLFSKRIEILPGQTLIETANLAWPKVRAETRFLIQWLDENDRVIGRTEVVVYPENLLAELKVAAGDDAVGIVDPAGHLSSLLKHLGIGLSELQYDDLKEFTGRLLIVCSPSSPATVERVRQILTLAKKGVSVVWIQPPPRPGEALRPSFRRVSVGVGCVVVALPETIANLSENPLAQLNLLHFVKLALDPEPAPWP